MGTLFLTGPCIVCTRSCICCCRRLACWLAEEVAWSSSMRMSISDWRCMRCWLDIVVSSCCSMGGVLGTGNFSRSVS